jgi:hypothetical protein
MHTKRTCTVRESACSNLRMGAAPERRLDRATGKRCATRKCDLFLQVERERRKSHWIHTRINSFQVWIHGLLTNEVSWSIPRRILRLHVAMLIPRHGIDNNLAFFVLGEGIYRWSSCSRLFLHSSDRIWNRLSYEVDVCIRSPVL